MGFDGMKIFAWEWYKEKENEVMYQFEMWKSLQQAWLY